MTPTFRDYQKAANQAICDYFASCLLLYALIKLFCGTGKSLIMFNCDAFVNKPLTIYVFPSLALVTQFYTDYLTNHDADMHGRHIVPKQILCISSELNISISSSKMQNTTNPAAINAFLNDTTIAHKFICVTYQSFGTLVDSLVTTGKVADTCIFDEAHHVTGEQVSRIIFDKTVKYAKRIVYFTATPINANGIIMYSRDNDAVSSCGPCIFNYTYLNGVTDNWLSPFEIYIDFYSQNTTKSLYESIARTALTSGNTRILTFHAAVNSNTDTAVRNFVDLDKFVEAYEKVRTTEFPDKAAVKRIQFKGLYASVSPIERKQILAEFDTTPDNEIFILSSCETIGEGVDTKSANMCVFVDPKQSHVKIIQNIGRIARPKMTGNVKGSILIPCWVDATNYRECGNDPEARDAVIRSELLAGGNFNGILNVTSALQQEDPDLYDACLKYPNCFTPKETQNSLIAQGYKIVFEYGGDELCDAINYLVGAGTGTGTSPSVSVASSVSSSAINECETDEEMLQMYANHYNVDILVHNGNLTEPVMTINALNDHAFSDDDDVFEDIEAPKERQVIRVFQFPEADANIETGAYKYAPIVKKGKNGVNDDARIYAKETLLPPKSHHKSKMNIHMDDEIKVLWGVDDFETMEGQCRSCILTCNVVRTDPLDVAKGIVLRANERVANGGRLLPRKIPDKKNRTTPELEQEYKDACKLGGWKLALKGKGKSKCSDEVKKLFR